MRTHPTLYCLPAMLYNRISVVRAAKDAEKNVIQFKPVVINHAKTLFMADLIHRDSKREVPLRVRATVINGRVHFSEEFKKHSLLIAFNEPDGRALVALSERASSAANAAGVDPECWTFKPLFKDPGVYDAFLKLPTDKSGRSFRFPSNVKLNPKKPVDLGTGRTVTVDFKLAVWYRTDHQDDRQYGLTLRLEGLQFEDDAPPTVGRGHDASAQPNAHAADAGEDEDDGWMP
jgi:hypothetical protein